MSGERNPFLRKETVEQAQKQQRYQKEHCGVYLDTHLPIEKSGTQNQRSKQQPPRTAFLIQKRAPF